MGGERRQAMACFGSGGSISIAGQRQRDGARRAARLAVLRRAICRCRLDREGRFRCARRPARRIGCDGASAPGHRPGRRQPAAAGQAAVLRRPEDRSRLSGRSVTAPMSLSRSAIIVPPPPLPARAAVVRRRAALDSFSARARPRGSPPGSSLVSRSGPTRPSRLFLPSTASRMRRAGIRRCPGPARRLAADLELTSLVSGSPPGAPCWAVRDASVPRSFPELYGDDTVPAISPAATRQARAPSDPSPRSARSTPARADTGCASHIRQVPA